MRIPTRFTGNTAVSHEGRVTVLSQSAPLPAQTPAEKALAAIIKLGNLHQVFKQKPDWPIQTIQHYMTNHADALTHPGILGKTSLNTMTHTLNNILSTLAKIKTNPDFRFNQNQTGFYHLTDSLETANALLTQGFSDVFNRYGFNLFLADNLNTLQNLIDDKTSYINTRHRGKQTRFPVLNVLVKHPIYDFKKLETTLDDQIARVVDNLIHYPIRQKSEKSRLSDLKHRKRLIWSIMLDAAGIKAVASPYRAGGHEIMLTDASVAQCRGLIALTQKPPIH